MSASLRQTLEVASVLAVIVSLLVVAYEIRQSNNIALVSTENEIRNNYASLDETLLNNPELSELLFKARDSNYNLEGVEQEIITTYLFRVLNSWRPVVTSYERGLLDQISYDAVFDDIRYVVEYYPAVHHIWRGIIADYPSRGSDPIFSFINELIGSN